MSGKNGFLKQIFSIGNDKKGFFKRKFIIIFGVKIYLKNYEKAERKARQAYLDYLESAILPRTNDFVPLTNKPYRPLAEFAKRERERERERESKAATNLNENATLKSAQNAPSSANLSKNSNSNSQNPNSAPPAKLIAFYLPQFHAIPLNDENFGKGFTEWNNAAKALPLFAGHYQPHLPIDVGFYDLSSDRVMHRQVELAKIYGIYGFCFYYYWFSGVRLLEKPIFNYLANKSLDLPFCLSWANENWSRLWDGGDKQVIMPQQLKEGDDERFFYDILPFFKDERYIRIQNKPVLIIYRLNLFEKERILRFIDTQRKLAQKEGFEGLYVIGAKTFGFEGQLEFGADAAVEVPPLNMLNLYKFIITPPYANKNANPGRCFDINAYVSANEYTAKSDARLFKAAFPGWDNTARKAQNGCDIYLCEPASFKIWLKNLIAWTKQNHAQDERFVFINAWNEWAEGAHLEPSTRYGYAYLQAAKEALEESEGENSSQI